MSTGRSHNCKTFSKLVLLINGQSTNMVDQYALYVAAVNKH